MFAAGRRWLSISIAVVAIGPGAVAGLVPNPGFEEGTDAGLSAWSIGAAGPAPLAVARAGTRLDRGSVVSWDSDAPKEGGSSLRIDSLGTGDDYALIASPEIRVLAGFEYEVSFHYLASGLQPENGDRTCYTACILDVFQHGRENGRLKRLANTRIITYTNSANWARLAQRFTPPPGTVTVQLRFALVNKYPDAKATVKLDQVDLQPLDTTLPNAGFEAGADERPEGWAPAAGGGHCAWVADSARTGKRCVSVADAPNGAFSGWSTELPVRLDRAYAAGGWIKGGNLAANGFIGGGALHLEFLDRDGQPVGEPTVSPAVGANAAWTRVDMPFLSPPADAVTARLTAGLQFCNGTAWFDDLEWKFEERVSMTVARLKRDPRPAPGVAYAENLLANGDCEAGTDGQPAGWTFVGKSEPDWTAAEVERFHTDGRPTFGVGRARGEWLHELTYAGTGALLLVSVDPPKSNRHQWYGRNQVDGYWLSAPMPCKPGRAYLAAAWLKPGASIEEAWYGPLELRFQDAKGRYLGPANFVRAGLNGVPSGRWSWWVSMPWVAPAQATAVRLRFGQELKADAGGWGRTVADNLAVWELAETATIPAAQEVGLRTEAFRSWFGAAHAQRKPPYLPAPADAPEYESAWGRPENVTLGNLFYASAVPVPVAFSVANLLGEERTISAAITRTDWLGGAEVRAELKDVRLGGSGEVRLTAVLPPSETFGAFHLDITLREGSAEVGRFSGRYAVLPPLERPRTAEPLWGVTPLTPLFGDGRPFEREMGEMFRVAGFRRAWVRMHWNSHNAAEEATQFAAARRVVLWYRALGIEPVLQLHPDWTRPIALEYYQQVGQRVATTFKGLVAVYGNHGIEQANSASPFRGGGKDRLTDAEYDTIVAGVYDGIKAVDPQATVLIGNIATDWEGTTVRRLYGAPGHGRFDGAILNAYLGILMTAQANLREFDAHGDKQKTVWQEETAAQRSPDAGDARRYGEADGAINLVRTWLSCVGGCGGRLKSFTQWGFSGSGEIFMASESLQPRPQFVAHAVMADTLADALFAGDRSLADVSIFEWTRPDGPLLVAWANAGERTMTFEAPAGQVTLTDLMGNRQLIQAHDGLVNVPLTRAPVYLAQGGSLALSKRLELVLGHGSRRQGPPHLRLAIRSHLAQETQGTVVFRGPVADSAPRPFTVAASGTIELDIPVKADLPTGKRTTFRAECTTTGGAVFTATAGLNFAQAVRCAQAPALDGSWKGWERAETIAFGIDDAQIARPSVPDEEYTGRDDIQGRLRLLWDDRCLYLGVEALDDVFMPQPARGQSGFMGDSIEFAVQPANLLTQSAPRWEYELYLPNGQNPPQANRRFPLPYATVEPWQTAVLPTGQRGNVNYQAAIPWQDLGIDAPRPGRTFSLSVVLNDADVRDRLSGGRGRVRWFQGVDSDKNPEGFGDVTLVEP